MNGYASFHGGHSDYGDGEGTISSIAASVRERGLVRFGFTEHMDVPPQCALGQWLDRKPSWVDDYVRDVQAEQGDGRILLGTEIEYVPGARDWTREQLARHPFDYVVGSVHYMRVAGEDVCIDCDRTRTQRAIELAGSAEALLVAYYEAHVVDLCSWGIATVVGHLDVVKKYLTPGERGPTPRVRSAVSGALEAMRDAGVAMDVNARGFIAACAEQYPAEWIAREALRVGVPVTLGDDSHGPADVGARLDRAVTVLRAVGYEEMCLVGPGGSLERVPLPG